MFTMTINTHVQTCKLAENELSAVSDATNVYSDAGSSASLKSEVRAHQTLALRFALIESSLMRRVAEGAKQFVLVT